MLALKTLKNKLITKKSRLRGKKVLLRLDLNVPIKDGLVVDTFRIDRIIPTVDFLVSQGAKVIIVSHLGENGEQSLSPVAGYLSKKFNTVFFPDWNNLFHIEETSFEEVAILENVRRVDGEMSNNLKTAKRLAALADIYVNEAFSVSHREQASVVGVAKFLPSYIGPLFYEECEKLSRVFSPQHPFLFILGGRKFKTKVPLLKKFIKQADQIFIGGALANSFLKKRGLGVGDSLLDDDLSEVTPFLSTDRIILPRDVVTEKNKEIFVRQADQIKPKEIVVDVGPETLNDLHPLIKDASFILWNGPLGNFEKGFNKATLDTARMISQSKAFSIVGGGDTVSAIADLGLVKEFGFVSTAGGAMLEFLAKGTLPGIKAILKNKVD